MDVDLGLRCQARGFRSVFEPASRVFHPRAHEPQTSEFVAGRQLERLFLRHAARQGWLRSSILHTLSVVAELVQGVVRPGLLLRLLGRVSVWPTMIWSGDATPRGVAHSSAQDPTQSGAGSEKAIEHSGGGIPSRFVA
jgi:hypothetical protein